MLRISRHGPITRIELARAVAGRALFWVSAYLLEDTLIDTGCPHTAYELAAWSRKQRVTRILNTHAHEDHVGGNARLGLPALAPELGLPVLEHPPRIPLYRRIVWGQPSPCRAEALGREVPIGPYRLRVVPTPGHSPEHTCFFAEREGWVFTGDLFLSPRAAYLRRDEDARGVLASLKQIRDLAPALLICSHAGFVTRPVAALERKIAFLEETASRAAELAAAGLPVRTIARRLLGPEGWMTVASAGEFSKRNLIRSLLNG